MGDQLKQFLDEWIELTGRPVLVIVSSCNGQSSVYVKGITDNCGFVAFHNMFMIR